MHIELFPAATYIQIAPLTPFGLGKVDSSVSAKGISNFKKNKRVKEEYKSNKEDHHKPE